MGHAIALLFDLDGTMLDTDHIHRAIFADMMKPYGLDITPKFYMSHVHGRLNEDFFAEFLPDLDDPKGMSAAKEAAFRDRLPRPYPEMPGVKDLVAHGARENWGLAIVTNAMRANAEAMLNAIDLRAAFEVIVIGDECAHGKPHPEPYLSAMDQLGVPPDRSIAFEDSPSGVKSAVASGAYTVGIRSSLGDAALRDLGAHDTLQDFIDPNLAGILARFS